MSKIKLKGQEKDFDSVKDFAEAQYIYIKAHTKSTLRKGQIQQNVQELCLMRTQLGQGSK